jgi:regulator of protease activity HflC (stomatin/prohibitin superfamily)
MESLLLLTLILFVVVGIVIAKSVRIVQEYERGVIFRLGRCVGAKGPGVFFVVPVIDKIVRTNLQIVAVSVPPQSIITRDNVTVNVDAVAYFQVVDPVASVVKIQSWWSAAQLVAQTSLRAVVGRHELDQLLSERERLDIMLQEALDEQTEEWGVKVKRVEIRDVGLPEQMQRAMARQAEAERDRRGKVIAAEGEFQASKVLADAAKEMAVAPGAMQLRMFQTMTEISAEHNSTIILPIPTELLQGFVSLTDLARRSGPQEELAPTTPNAVQVGAAAAANVLPTDPLQ